ncbi:MAG: hypothetical protein M0R80_01010 [Proteobacteria bacterium]|jgi:hypothetical protein|nr:hypothetical protein [Pseudomonadota bacterium]
MKFKIGDKVKVIGNSIWTTTIGVVVGLPTKTTVYYLVSLKFVTVLPDLTSFSGTCSLQFAENELASVAEEIDYFMEALI